MPDDTTTIALAVAIGASATLLLLVLLRVLRRQIIRFFGFAGRLMLLRSGPGGAADGLRHVNPRMAMHRIVYGTVRALRLRAVVPIVAQILLLPIYIPLYAVACLASRISKRVRLRRGERPRLVWGPYPNYCCVEISKALRPHGYVCDTIVYYNFDRIWDSSEFTFCLDKALAGVGYRSAQLLKRTVAHHLVFMYVMLRYDVVHGFFYSGFLRETIFEWLEVQLLHLGGCKQLNTTIGGDVAYMPHIESHVIRQGMNDMYPYTTQVREQKSIRRHIRYFSKHSDFIICQCSYMIDCLPRWDLLVTQYFPIDTEHWAPLEDGDSNADGRNGVVRIGHSPNHRPLKGTNFLIRAVNELRDEGYKIELVLLEKHQNRAVKDILGHVDIVVADLVLQGYAVMATEGMALGKPVVQDISDPHYNRVFKLYTGLDEAPFVSVPLEDAKDELRRLVTDPELRHEIGRRSREYVLKYHSYEASHRFWSWVYEYLWFERRERVAFYHPDWPVSTLISLNQVIPSDDDRTYAAAIQAELEQHRDGEATGPIGFYPVTPETFVNLERLVKTGVIRSNDYFVRDPRSEVPAGTRKLPQAVIDLADIPEYGVKSLFLFETDAIVERTLAEISRRHPDYDFSVNDQCCVRWPAEEQVLTKPYRQLELAYRAGVVPPLHYSNHAYINHVKRLVRPGMRVLDAFSGPGTVGLSIARECGLAEVSLFDCNPDAVKMIRMNAERNFGDSVEVHAYESDLFHGVPEKCRFDVIIGNPPHSLDREGLHAHLDRLNYVQANDPGMHVHRRFFEQATRHLTPGGLICLLENGDEECIGIDHLRELLAEFPAYEISEWQWMAGSRFYAVTIQFRPAAPEESPEPAVEVTAGLAPGPALART